MNRRTRGVAAILAVGLVVALAWPAALAFAGDAAKGKASFDRLCVACHGKAGKGDGPGAAALNPKPRDLTDPAVMAKLADEQIFEVIKKGGAAVGKSPLMPPWGGQLKDEQIQDVVAYVRSLAKQ